MTTEKVKDLLFEQFMIFMLGQTYGEGPDGQPDWYETDVNRFIRQIRK